MSSYKAVIFDYLGTLVCSRNYSMDASKEKLCSALVDSGFKIDKEKFLKSYSQTHEKYRIIRYERFKEVTNAVWVAETLRNLGFRVSEDDLRIKEALNAFFKEFIDTLALRPNAKKVITHAKSNFKLGLISNFTYAPVIYASLKQLGINEFFNVVVVSEENGWRKPSKHIFQEALNKLQVNAQSAVFIGDSPIEDIKGAKEVGLKTVFIPSQFNSLKDLVESMQKPDFIFKNLKDFYVNFAGIVGN